MREQRSHRVSGDGRYRYVTTRRWEPEPRRCLTVIGLHPHEPDPKFGENTDDLTIARTRKFAHEWGWGAVRIVNLFAYRTNNWRDLEQLMDPVGPANDDAIFEAVIGRRAVLCAWGTKGAIGNRGAFVLDLIRQCSSSPYVLGLTPDGSPLHVMHAPVDQFPCRMPVKARR